MRPATCPSHPAAERQRGDVRAGRLTTDRVAFIYRYKTTQIESQHFDRIWEGDQNSMTQILNFEATLLRAEVRIQLELIALTVSRPSLGHSIQTSFGFSN